ncbi:DUF4241 domain-containing protein [Streptomyces nojiriensis]|uniref:DUF4241 domain-containing protein n=1 Tax=Streptomyces nojiriensis TaxID=66374 RepID=UPI0036DCD7CB
MTDTIADVTTIRVPSGRLIVDSPWSENHGREMVARIPPGTYRAEAAWTEAPYEHGGEYFDGREGAATRLRVSDDPVVVWEAGGGVEGWTTTSGMRTSRRPGSTLTARPREPSPMPRPGKR